MPEFQPNFCKSRKMFSSKNKLYYNKITKYYCIDTNRFNKLIRVLYKNEF